MIDTVSDLIMLPRAIISTPGILRPNIPHRSDVEILHPSDLRLDVGLAGRQGRGVMYVSNFVACEVAQFCSRLFNPHIISTS